jgi:hypothetical protein
MFQFPEDVLDTELHVVAIVFDSQDIYCLVAGVICERGWQEFWKTLKINIKTVI